MSVKRAAAALLLCALLPLMTGCWDNHELDSLFIVTGVALDKAEEPGEVDITVQIGKVQSNTDASSQSSQSGGPGILLQKTAHTVLEGIVEINRSSSRSLLLQHNQTLLFGKELAQAGVRDRLDMFMRDQDTRLEVLILVVDGRAEDILAVEPEQEVISGVYVSRVINDLKAISPHHAVRLLDFVSRLWDGTSAPVAPIARVEQKGEKQNIQVEGLAIFKEDRMVGVLDNEQARGYVWAMGSVQHSAVIVKTDLGVATLNIVQLGTQRELALLPTGNLHVTLSVNAILEIGELNGFADVTPNALMPHLVEAAQDQIRRQILGTFEIARALEADIYQFGVSFHRKYPKLWKEMKDAWGGHFAQTQLDVRVKAGLPAMGQTVVSLEMQEERQ